MKLIKASIIALTLTGIAGIATVAIMNSTNNNLTSVSVVKDVQRFRPETDVQRFRPETNLERFSSLTDVQRFSSTSTDYIQDESSFWSDTLFFQFSWTTGNPGAGVAVYLISDDGSSHDGGWSQTSAVLKENDSLSSKNGKAYIKFGAQSSGSDYYLSLRSAYSVITSTYYF
ncbi:MAG: hypothetical protein LBM76_01255 [Mycoplasmataceae bacterium]|nr:hypothetical protein [Mycoplasmataceae bacterium]